MGYRNYSTAISHIVDSTGQGDFTTISAAISAATTAGYTNVDIFIRPGTYTENITLASGVNLIAFNPNSVTIIGKISLTVAGSCLISGLNLQTNNDYIIAVTGSSASNLRVLNCTAQCTNHSGVNYTSSSSSASLYIEYSTFNLATTGISAFTMASAGIFQISYSYWNNSGLSTTASTMSSGITTLTYSAFGFPIHYSGTEDTAMTWCTIDCTALNATALTCSSANGIIVTHSTFSSNTATAIQIDGGAVCTMSQSSIFSSNTNAIGGTGTLNAAILIFVGSSHTIQGTLTVNVLSTGP